MKDKIRKHSTLWNRDFLLAMLVSATATLAYGMFSPALPVYSEKYGVGPDLVGTIVAVATGLSMIGRAVIGWLSDQKSKKRLVLCSLITMAVSYTIYFLPASPPVIAAARILQGIGNGMLITVLSTLALENLPLERLGEGIGIYSLSSALAQCVSPLIGTDFAKSGHFTLIFVSALTTTLFSIVALVFIRSTPTVVREPQDSSGVTAKRTMKSLHMRSLFYRDALLGAIMLLFMGIVHSAISNYLAIYGLKLGLEQIGLFFTINSIALLLSRPVLGKLADKIKPGCLIVPGFLMIAVSCFLLSNLHRMMGVYICGILYGIGFGAVQSTSQMISIKSAPLEKRGIANSTYYVLGDVGLSLGAFLSGYLSTLIGYEFMFFIMSGISVLAVGAFCAGRIIQKQNLILK